jgi:hypothetical protein
MAGSCVGAAVPVAFPQTTTRKETYSGRSDVYSPGCQIDGKARHESLDEDIDFGSDFGSGETGGRHEVIAPREYQGQESDPAEEAARNLDWESFLRDESFSLFASCLEIMLGFADG